jgi:hypothetical protein
MPNGNHWSIGALEVLDLRLLKLFSCRHITGPERRQNHPDGAKAGCVSTATSPHPQSSLSSLPFPFPLPLPSSTPLLLSSLLLLYPHSPSPPHLCYHVQEVCFSQFCPSPPPLPVPRLTPPSGLARTFGRAAFARPTPVARRALPIKPSLTARLASTSASQIGKIHQVIGAVVDGMFPSARWRPRDRPARKSFPRPQSIPTRAQFASMGV